MADSSIHSRTSANLDSKTQATGNHRQVVTIGDPVAANTMVVDSSGRPTVNIFGTVATTATPATPTVYSKNSTADTNLVSVKATAGTIYGLTVSNIGAGLAYLKVYNKATAPALATDIPLLVIPIPAAGFPVVNAGAMGIRFSAGIAISITGAGADNDTTAVAAGQVKVVISYI